VITVITGPPCSGKTTWVREHAKPGDLIIDFDLIAQALGSPESHDHPDWIREVTAAAWAAAIRRATQDRHKVAWIIDSRPRPERQQAYDRARARHVRLTASKDDLHRRADTDSRSPQCHQRIDEFLGAGSTAGRVEQRTRW